MWKLDMEAMLAMGSRPCLPLFSVTCLMRGWALFHLAFGQT